MSALLTNFVIYWQFVDVFGSSEDIKPAPDKYWKKLETNKVDDLDKYIEQRKKKSHNFAKNFDAGYERFKAEVLRSQISTLKNDEVKQDNKS